MWFGVQLDLLIERSFGGLQFLLDEFSKLEVMLAPASKEGESAITPFKHSYVLSLSLCVCARFAAGRLGPDNVHVW